MEFPTTNLNENLIGAGLNTSNPQNTYVDFATQMAKNSMEQKQMEENLAKAKLMTQQAQIQTKQQQEASDKGFNPQLIGTMTPEQAVAQAKLIFQQKGTPVDEAIIDKWAATLPPVVQASQVEEFASRFARETNRLGQPFVATKNDAEGDKTDENGDPLVSGQTYAALYNNQGNIQSYVRSGQEKPDQSGKLSLKESEASEKQWQKLDSQINIAFKTRSGGLGSLSTAIFRATRAINTITDNENLTAQDLSNISQDIAGIYQGGAPSIVGSRENDYGTIFTNLANTFRKYTGILPKVEGMFGAKSPLEATKAKLLQVLVDLRDTSIANLKVFVESEEPAYEQIINDDPDRWQKMQEKKLKFIESGLLVPPGANTNLNITGIEHATESKNPAETGIKKSKGSKVVPKYTVED
jgi:hypothetical protein